MKEAIKESADVSERRIFVCSTAGLQNKIQLELHVEWDMIERTEEKNYWLKNLH